MLTTNDSPGPADQIGPGKTCFLFFFLLGAACVV
jgi:hypothetical protein